MTGEGATVPPLVVEFEVAASPEAAFDMWVSRPGLWWPPGHTISRGPEAIVFEPRAGGRMYERDAEGAELAWGEVLEWERPTRFRCRWHHVFPPAEATTLEVAFAPTAGGTLVRLVQTGWDALGDQGPVRRERTHLNWPSVTDAYRRRLDQDRPHDPDEEGSP